MKNLILAAALFAGIATVSAQVTPPQRKDTTRTDTLHHKKDMRNDDVKDKDRSKTDTSGNWRSKDAVKDDKKIKMKSK